MNGTDEGRGDWDEIDSMIEIYQFVFIPGASDGAICVMLLRRAWQDMRKDMRNRIRIT